MPLSVNSWPGRGWAGNTAPGPAPGPPGPTRSPRRAPSAGRAPRIALPAVGAPGSATTGPRLGPGRWGRRGGHVQSIVPAPPGAGRPGPDVPSPASGLPAPAGRAPVCVLHDEVVTQP